MDTRRLYINSKDTDNQYPYNESISINLEKANLGCESDQALGVSLVKAELPTTLEAVPRTTAVIPIAQTLPTYAGKNIQGRRDISVLSYTYNGSAKRIIFNDADMVNEGNSALGTFDFMNWDINTSIETIVAFINGQIGSVVLGIDDLGTSTPWVSLNRLTIVSTTTSDYISFIHDESTRKILRVLGLHQNKDTVITSTALSPYPFDVGNALPVVYLTTSLGVGGYHSHNTLIPYDDLTGLSGGTANHGLGQTSEVPHQGGTVVNILGAITTKITDQVFGRALNSTYLQTGDNQMWVASSTGNIINYVNHGLVGSHKIIHQDHINNIRLNLVDENLIPIGTNGQDWSCTLEFKIVRSNPV